MCMTSLESIGKVRHHLGQGDMLQLVALASWHQDDNNDI